MQLQGSVGANGINARADVLVIQQGLNTVGFKPVPSPLSEDGLIGPKTLRTIRRFQREIVRMINPDGRIDPGGRSLKILSLYSAKAQAQPQPRKAISSPKSTARPVTPTTVARRPISPITMHGLSSAYTITYRRRAKPVLSHYTKSVLKQIMILADVSSIDISSTWRAPADQARIMFNDNMKAKKQGSSLFAVRLYNYRPPGQAVDKVFANNFGKKTDAEIKQLMEAEIVNQLNAGQRVSQHCVTKAMYDGNNIFDIPYSSVTAAKQAAFEEVLLAYAASFNARRHSKGGKNSYTVAQKPIAKVIVEQYCWHVELPQTSQLLPLLP